MDTIECIHTRRSIRKYTGKNVPDELVKEILAAGMTAPSAKNQQPWQFIVVTDKALLREISSISNHVLMAKDAALGILVCADLSLVISEGFWVQDCAAAVENMLLAAHALGLGAVWTGVYPREKRVDAFRTLFKLPENIIPHTFIPIGHPAQKSKRENRFKQERIHRNGW